MPKPIQHPFLSGDWSEKPYQDYVENKMTPQEYKTLLEGGYDVPDDYNVSQAIVNGPHNKPEINDTIDVEKFFNNPHFGSLANYPEFSSNKIKSWLESGKSDLASEFYDHSQHKDPELSKLFLKHGMIQEFVKSLEHAPEDKISNYAKLANEFLTDKKTHPMLTSTPESRKRMFQHLPAEDVYQQAKTSNNPDLYQELPIDIQHRLNDDFLGIKGGEHSRMGDIEDPEDNYDNWIHGPDHSERMASYIAEYGNLTNAQADHIARHAPLEDRFKMFHENSGFDPSIKTRMYNKWRDDDHRHGYDIDDYKKMHYDEKNDNAYEDSDLYNEASQQARENYSYDDFLRNEDRQLWDKYDDPHEARQAIIDKHFDGDEGDADEKYDEELSDSVHENIHELARDRYHHEALDHLDHLPDDMIDHESFAPIREEMEQSNLSQQRQKELKTEAGEKTFHDSRIPNRKDHTEYAPGQRQAELLRDVAAANGGAIDIGSMHKLYPNLKDTWKSIFGNRSKITSDEAQTHIDQLPKTKWNVSHGVWHGSQIQNLNRQDQTIFRLDHSDDTKKQIEDLGLSDTFKKISQLSRNSGHPTKADTIGWARVDTTNPKHWIIDETQTDYGKAVRKFLGDNDKEQDAKNIDKLMELQAPWHAALVNHVIQTAKDHGVERISTHTPETKAEHTGADKVHSVYKEVYGVMPNYGFQKTDANDIDALTTAGKKQINLIENNPFTQEDLAERADMHHEAAVAHLHNAGIHTQMAQDHKDSLGLAQKAQLMAATHASVSMAKQHKAAGLAINPDHEGLKGLSVEPSHDPAREPDVQALTIGYNKLLSPQKTKAQKFQTLNLNDPTQSVNSLKKSAAAMISGMISARYERYQELLQKGLPKTNPNDLSHLFEINKQDPGRQALDAALNGDWSEAIKIAKKAMHDPEHRALPNRLASLREAPIPPEHLDEFLNAFRSEDIPYYISQNSHPLLQHKDLEKLLTRDPDRTTAQYVSKHPNWQPHLQDSFIQKLKPHAFWTSYESKVHPEHFQAVAEAFGQHQYDPKKTHRGHASTDLDNLRIETSLYHNGTMRSAPGGNQSMYTKNQSYIPVPEILPTLKQHAKNHQDMLMESYYNDNPHGLEFKTIKGKQFIKLYRGVGGKHANDILRHADYNPENHTIANKTIKLPSAPFSSWTQDPSMARSFALGRGGVGEPGHPVVIEAWHPLENVLHTGIQSTHPVLSNVHPNEKEFILHHPDLTHSVKTTGIHTHPEFVDQEDPYGSTAVLTKPKVIRKKT